MTWKKREKYSYHFWHVISRSITSLFFRPKVIGKNNIPKTGRVIIAPNHRSFFDIPVLGCVTYRPLRFMVKREMYENPFIKWYFSFNGSFCVDRENGDPKAVKKAISVLNGDDALVLFPEGHRNRFDTVGDLLDGVGFFAVKAKAPIVPIAIANIDKPIVKKLWIFPIFAKAKAIVGEPITSHIDMEGKTSDKVRHVMSELQTSLEELYQEAKLLPKR